MKKIILIVTCFLFNLNILFSQCVDAGPDLFVCSGPVNLTATLNCPLYGDSVPATQVFLSDDVFSGVVNIGFPFTYYGNVYNQCVISSNNFITFNLANANTFSQWTITNPIPDPFTPSILNAVLGPWQDINPGVGGTITYKTVGTAPNRVFVVEYCNVPMFSCTGLLFSSQIMLFEGTNQIETHIINKPLCTTWNNGRAIHGLQDATGSPNSVVVGTRNSPNQWTTANEGYRFIPSGSSYTVNPITFGPAIMTDTTINPLLVLWYELGNPVPIDTGLTITVNPPVTTTYIVEITGNGCAGISGRDTVVVNILAPFPIITGNPSYCAGDSVLLSTTQPFSNYLWSTGETTPTIYATQGSYTVMVMDTAGCNNTSAPFTITESPLPSAGASLNSPICSGNLLIIDASSSSPGGIVSYDYNFDGDTIYEYSFNQPLDTFINLSPGSYTIEFMVTTSDGCLDTGTLSLEVYDNPIVDLLSDPIQVCEGVPFDLQANASVNNPPPLPSNITNYSWDFGNDGIVDTSGSSLSNLNYSFPSSGSFWVGVEVTSVGFCTSSDSILLIVNPSPIAGFSSNSVCLGDISSLTDTSYIQPPGVINTYSWNITNSSGFSFNSSNQNLSQIFPDAGIYTVVFIVTSSDGCIDSVNQTISVNPVPELDFFYTTNCFQHNTFHDQSSGGTSPLTTQWDLNNDGIFDTTANNFQYWFPDSSDQIVTILVTDANGCFADSTFLADVKGGVNNPHMPNVLSLSSSAGNDRLDFEQFAPGFNSCINYTFSIFNRWGTKIYEFVNDANSPDLNCNFCFTGLTETGAKINSGTYYYVLRGDNDIVLNGTITVFE